jgi:pyruvate formate-lyase/glycerol dehydratase family glycyl radical enzyme
MADAIKFLAELRKARLKKHDLRPVWEGEAFVKFSDEPMAVRRARALKNVLENAGVCIRKDEKLFGSVSGCFADKLPFGYTKEKANKYIAAGNDAGKRDFLGNVDHSAPDYGELLFRGLHGMALSVRGQMDTKRPTDEFDFLSAVLITLEAASSYISKHAAFLSMEAKKTGGIRGKELLRSAKICEKIAFDIPGSFEEAVQLVCFIHLIFAIEGRGAMALGRFDQYFFPFYKKDINSGKLTRKGALELVKHFWAKLEEPGINNPVQNICIGGFTPDGKDATNELSYICLKATSIMQTPRSNLSARLHDSSSGEFIKACARVIRTGVGFPAIFNDEVLVPALIKKGVSVKDARDLCFVGCVETFVSGKQPPWSDSRFNILECVNKALRRKPPTFKKLEAQFEKEVMQGVKEHAAGINAYKAKFPSSKYMDPFLSAFIKDCVKKGRDMNNGGTRYPDAHGIAGMGLGTTADALAAVKKLVYEEKRISIPELIRALDADFAGYEDMRQELLNKAPKYGNNDPVADRLAARVTEIFCKAVHPMRTNNGGWYFPLMGSNVANIPAGKEVGATPDGRKAFTPLSDSASPHFGRDRLGPTAVINSISHVDYTGVTGGTVVNMKFSPDVFAGEDGLQRFATLLSVFIKKRGMEVQFNMTGAKVMKDAQKNPEKYMDLIVRVSGFSALFTELAREVQDDIIGRTEHGRCSI